MTASKTSFWAEQDRVDLLKASWIAGHSAREIASALSAVTGLAVTRNMVISKAARLGLPMHQNIHSWRGIKAPERKPA